MTAAGIELRVGWRECWVVAALAAYALARLSPPLESLSPQGQAVLGAMAAGAMLWISEATPIGVTAIVVTALSLPSRRQVRKTAPLTFPWVG